MRGNEWQEWEIELLRRHYPKRGARWDGWETLLPSRTPCSIERKASALGVRSARFWTSEEDRILRLYYETKPKGWGGWRKVLPNKTRRQVTERAGRLGIKSPRRGRLGGWTDEDRRDLVLSVRGVAERTGHPFTGCINELNNIRKRRDKARRAGR